MSKKKAQHITETQAEYEFEPELGDHGESGVAADWLDHPYTRRLRKQSAENVKNLSVKLMQACADSTDPSVRQAYEGYVRAKQVRNVFTNGEE